MKFPLTEKLLILSFCALFIISALFLFWKNTRELDPDLGKNWWTLSFAVPEDPKSLAFTVDNHTAESTFTYEVSYTATPDKIISTNDSLTVSPGQAKTTIPNFVPQPDFRTTITVTLGKETKQIYR